MKNIKCLIIALAVGIGVCGIFAGCTPESPPLDPRELSDVQASDTSTAGSSAQEGRETSQQSSSASSAQESREPSASSSQTSRESSEAEPVDGSGYDKPAGADIVVWDTNAPLPDSVMYSFSGVGGSTDHFTNDKQLIMDLTYALSNVHVTGETTQRVEDSNHTIILSYDNDADSNRKISFEGSILLYDGKGYEVSGFKEVYSVLSKIPEVAPESSADISGDEEFTQKMMLVDCKLSELWENDEYKTGSVEKRRDMALSVLHELEAQGLIKKGSIYYDGHDNISFIYNNCEEGVLGGIMLKDFDPMMN